jgi:hypothetical protein
MIATRKLTKSDKTDCIAWESAEDKKTWVCICGNTLSDSGFFTCDKKGRQVEPTPEEWTTDCYVCAECGRIIRMDDLRVLGFRSADARTLSANIR